MVLIVWVHYQRNFIGSNQIFTSYFNLPWHRFYKLFKAFL